MEKPPTSSRRSALGLIGGTVALSAAKIASATSLRSREDSPESGIGLAGSGENFSVPSDAIHYRISQNQPARSITSKLSELVSVTDFGALGDDSDQTLQVQSAYDFLAQKHQFGTLYFPPGVYRFHLQMQHPGIHILGGGNNACIFRPVDDRPVLNWLHVGGWEILRLSSFSIVGLGTARGTGIQLGHASFVTGDDLIGRLAIDHVQFANIGTAIARSAGNIGLWVSLCSFEGAAYHVWTRALRPLQQAGVLFVRECSMRGAEKAVFYIDGQSVPSAGQIAVRDCVIQGNPGFVYFVRDLYCDGSPAITVDNCWNEANYTASAVRVDDTTLQPKFARLENVTHARFSETPLGSLELKKAAVSTHYCPLDNLALEQDSDSSIKNADSRISHRGAPTKIESLGASAPGAANAPFLWMPHPTHTTLAYGSAVRMFHDCTTTIRLGGRGPHDTKGVQGDGVLPDTNVSQEVTVPANEILTPEILTVGAGKWLVATVVCKHIAGPPVTLRITGDIAISQDQAIDFPEWRTLRLLYRSWKSPGSQAFNFVGNKEGASVIRLGGLNMVEFDDRQMALDFLNSRGIAR